MKRLIVKVKRLFVKESTAHCIARIRRAIRADNKSALVGQYFRQGTNGYHNKWSH